jgi:predicted RNA-binding Zn ribbon-like protein
MLPAFLQDTPQVGGALCLDFVNTVDSWRRPDRTDYIPDYSAVAAWAAQVGAVSDTEAERLMRLGRVLGPQAERVHSRAVSLREALYRILSPAYRREPGDAWLGIVNEEFRRAMALAALKPRNDTFRLEFVPADELDQVLWSVVQSAVDLAVSTTLGRVRACDGEDCGWLFIDTSRGGRRRWCSMALCGNRTKSKRRRKRARMSRGGSIRSMRGEGIVR